MVADKQDINVVGTGGGGLSGIGGGADEVELRFGDSAEFVGTGVIEEPGEGILWGRGKKDDSKGGINTLGRKDGPFQGTRGKGFRGVFRCDGRLAGNSVMPGCK